MTLSEIQIGTEYLVLIDAQIIRVQVKEPRSHWTGKRRRQRFICTRLDTGTETEPLDPKKLRPLDTPPEQFTQRAHFGSGLETLAKNIKSS